MIWSPCSQSISWWLTVQPQNRHPLRDLPQTCRGIKSACLIFIWSTYNFQSHLMTSFIINNIWSSKCKIHRSTTIKGILRWWYWRIFYFKKKVDLRQQEVTSNHNYCHNRIEDYVVSKSMCLICIRTTDNSHHAWGEFSVSMISDPVNSKYTGQQ